MNDIDCDAPRIRSVGKSLAMLKARKMSPELLPPGVPFRPMPMIARLATRRS